MKSGAFIFSGDWMERVKALPESGMGYTIVCVTLKDGRIFDQAIIDSGYLTKVRGLPDVPFTEKDIVSITATHEKWDWKKEG